MIELKKGDKVVLYNFRRTSNWTYSMDKYLGKTMTVERVDCGNHESGYNTAFRAKEDLREWFYEPNTYFMVIRNGEVIWNERG